MGGSTLRPTAPVWLASSDGIGHARIERTDWNAVCGVRLPLVRLSHPIRERCLGCLDKVGVSVSARTSR